MKPAEERLAPELRALAVDDPRDPGGRQRRRASRSATARSSIEALIRQVSSPVRWEDVVRRLVAEGVRTFVELGPGTVLAGLIRKIDRTVTTMSVENVQGLDKALAAAACGRARKLAS